MNYLKISIGIFLTLALTRFIPHPPNFTSLIALSFYVPALIGIKYLPAVIISFFFTDLIIGFHQTVLFTWGSVILIGIISKYFAKGMINRISGSLLGVIIFFIVTNFGVWTLGSYGYTFNGLIVCYFMALPFFGYNIISTLVFSTIIETAYKIKFIKSFLNSIQNTKILIKKL
tara:strand:- start:2771 stop:3289 length:519 start_codon:yes stop_codon:yes gene_type:complete